MNMQRFLTGTRSVLAVIPMMAVFLLGNTSAWGQAATATPPRQFTVTVPVSGTVNGDAALSAATSAASTSENVTFPSGNVQIDATLARDPDFNQPPKLIINITFLRVVGVGAISKKNYIADARVTKVRRLRGTDPLEITFPFAPDTPLGFLEARAGRATFTLTFDTNGTITGATGTIDTPALL